MPAAMPDLEAQLRAVVAEVPTEIDVTRRRRVFCNRNLRMNQVEMIGFDMDYTLALYHQDKLEQLSIDLTLGKMCGKHGYPDEIRRLHYEPDRAIRGLMVDRKLGNVFKLDRHSHVGRCYHGFRMLSSDERRTTYRTERINLSDDRYEWIDTLFGLPEAVMYVTLVDYFERTGKPVDFDKLFGDIRMSIDEAHRDDTLKSVIRADLPSFIQKDPDLPETLHKLRSSGKKLFLLTNSLYDYTDAVMRYLLGGSTLPYPSWRHFFDYVIVGGAKPAFFTEQLPFIPIDPTTGRQLTTEVKALTRDRVYQGGNLLAFEQMTGIRGEHVLYVGDHIYGDILRVRKQHMWRTAMIIQELDRELSLGDRLEGQLRDLDLLDRRRRNLESEIDFQALRLKRVQRLHEEAAALQAAHVISPGVAPVAAVAAGASMTTTPIAAGAAAGAVAAGGAVAGLAAAAVDVSHVEAARASVAVAGAFGLPAPAPGASVAAVPAVAPVPAPVAPLPAIAPDILHRLDAVKRQIKETLDRLRDRARLMTEEVELLEDATERAFNPYWGPVLREGNENSRFGEQVGDYADLYTSRVSNFLSYSPLRYFRAPRRAMPHDL